MMKVEPQMPSWASGKAAFAPGEILAMAQQIRSPLLVLRETTTGRMGIGIGAELAHGEPGQHQVVGMLPPLFPEWLGDRTFCEVHRVRFPYIAGAMANGIASPEMVVEMARAGMLGFFGAGGLGLAEVEAGIDRIRGELSGKDASFGSNLIFSPHEPELENAVSDLYLRANVRRVSAAAYMSLTPAVVRYGLTGLRRDGAGRITRANHVFAKVSRPEIARLFLSPAPRSMVQALVASGKLSPAEAELGERVPLAEDITVEADSGGHTDNRPLPVLFPTILSLRDELAARFSYERPVRVGAAGGLGTPSAVASAFGLGAAYVLTGSVNQSARESMLSDAGKAMLAQADLADVVMAPSPDMFEMGGRVQVLRRGTLFAQRALRLYQIFLRHESLEAVPVDQRAEIEKEIFCATLSEVWEDTRRYFAERSPSEIERAQRDPKHRMALTFRWYLGKASRWAIQGDPRRKLDYQIWCGPAMGSFNTWVKGSFMEGLEDRTVVQIALNLLEGAAVVTRAQQLRSAGVHVPPEAFSFRPRRLA